MDIQAIHTAIAGVVNTAALQGTTLQVTATDFMPLLPEVPHFYPFNWRITYDRTYGGGGQGGMAELVTTWHLVVSNSNDESAYQEATRLAGTGESTIRAALIAARGAPGVDALDGAGGCEDLRPTGASGPTSVDVGDLHLLVVEVPIWVVGH